MIAIEENTLNTQPQVEIDAALALLIRGKSLPACHADQVAEALIGGRVDDPRAAAILTALRCKGENAVEIAAFARKLRRAMVAIDVDFFECVDTCGTGGDGLQTFNVSTAAAIVAASAGCPVAKHGNRSVSSQSGSTDVLQQLGITVDQKPTAALANLRQSGIAFLHAPSFHPALKRLAPLRRQLGFRSIFNIVGPLCNPTNTRRQVMGVFEDRLVGEVALAARDLGADHMLVVHGDDGADEISISGPTTIAEVRGGQIEQYQITPEEFGIPRQQSATIRTRDVAQSAAMIDAALRGTHTAARDAVVLNAGAAIYVSARAEDLAGGIQQAREAINTGAAAALLKTLQTRRESTMQYEGAAR